MTVYQGSRYVTAPVANPPRATKPIRLYSGPDNPAVDAYLKALAAAASSPLYPGPDNALVDAYQRALAAAKKRAAPQPKVPTLFPKRPARRNTVKQPTAFSERVVIQGDRFDLLAAALLGDPRRWWMIADLNPDILFPFDDLTPGSVIRIPVSATAHYAMVNQTFVPPVFSRVFDGQSVPL